MTNVKWKRTTENSFGNYMTLKEKLRLKLCCNDRAILKNNKNSNNVVEC